MQFKLSYPNISNTSEFLAARTDRADLKKVIDTISIGTLSLNEISENLIILEEVPYNYILFVDSTYIDTITNISFKKSCSRIKNLKYELNGIDKEGQEITITK